MNFTPSELRIFIYVCESLVLIIGILGNSIFLISTYRSPLGSELTTRLIRLQCVIDAVCCLLSGIIIWQPDFWMTDLSLRLDHFICHTWHSQALFWIMIDLSILNLVLVTIDRFVAVVYPLRYRLGLSWKLHLVVGVALVLFTFFIKSLSFLETNFDWNYGNCSSGLSPTSPVTKRQFGFYSAFIFVVFTVNPIILVVILYVCILWTLRRNWLTLQQRVHGGDSNNFNDPKAALARRFTVTTFVTAVIFVISFSVDSYVYVYEHMVSGSYQFSNPLQKVGVFMVAVNSCANPIVFAVMMPTVRKTISDTICCRQRVRPSENNAGNNVI